MGNFLFIFSLTGLIFSLILFYFLKDIKKEDIID
jgi:hypothetical protein